MPLSTRIEEDIIRTVLCKGSDLVYLGWKESFEARNESFDSSLFGLQNSMRYKFSMCVE